MPTTAPATSDLTWVISFMTSTMHIVLLASTRSPTLANGGAPGCGDRHRIPGDGETTRCTPGGRSDGCVVYGAAVLSGRADSLSVSAGIAAALVAPASAW